MYRFNLIAMIFVAIKQVLISGVKRTYSAVTRRHALHMPEAVGAYAVSYLQHQVWNHG
jgi:hypothetical protein